LNTNKNPAPIAQVISCAFVSQNYKQVGGFGNPAILQANFKGP